jgi:hypothetical protein
MSKLRNYSNEILSNYSDEYYTSYEQVKDAIERVILDKTWKILCPFDTDKSQFVIYLKANGYNVTHLKPGEKNTDYNPENYDVIITNPPWRDFIKLYSDYFDRAPRFIAILSWTTWWAIEKNANRKMEKARSFGAYKYRSIEPRIKFNATNSDKQIDCFYMYKGFNSGNNITQIIPLKI